MTTITLTTEQVEQLDITAAQTQIEALLEQARLGKAGVPEQTLRFQIEIAREPGDPRELSEIPEVRLWFIRLDATYPCLPLVLDWQAGELGRYVAMLVPHQFHPKDGILYNPEALEIFVMQKIFVLIAWLQQRGLEKGRSRLKAMTQLLGYEVEDGLFEVLGF
jgi:hypothetical protein